MALDRIVKRTSPHLFDKVIGDMQQGIADNVTWIDHIFGRAERLLKVIAGRRYYTPNWYRGDDEYILLAPDQGLGCYGFFVLDEPQDVSWSAGLNSRLEAPFSLIVWADMREVDTQTDTRDTEKGKQDILKALNGGTWVHDGGFVINRIYERAENVFRGFTLDEVDNQFLMSPFAGWRFDGVMTIKNDCI